jgi:hypothetical protein
VKLLGHDIVAALWREQQRLLPRLLLRRAREDYERTKDTARPVVSITGADDVAHRMLREGLGAGTELAACGKDVNPAFDDNDRLITRGPVACRQCLQLLKRVAGRDVYEEQLLKRAAALRKRSRR